jgi:urease accessory protein
MISSAVWQGNLQLEFSYGQGMTHLSRSRIQAPLKVQRPFYPEGVEVCHTVILHTAGGVVGGDRLSLDIHLQPQSHALITTAAAGKVYRSNGMRAHQTAQIRVAEGACLEWLPQETIVFNQANVYQELRVELAANAMWLGWEITRLGRSARGETFLGGEWRSRTEVWQGGRPLWIDPQWLQGGTTMLTSPYGLAGCPVVGSFALVGRSVSPELIEKLREALESNGRSVPHIPLPSPPSPYPSEIGITRLMEGLLCRYRGFSTSEVRRWFIAIWHLLRLSFLNRPACKPRVWQL